MSQAQGLYQEFKVLHNGVELTSVITDADRDHQTSVADGTGGASVLSGISVAASDTFDIAGGIGRSFRRSGLTFSVELVPEPSSMALFGLVTAGIAARRKAARPERVCG
ncbi:MAG: PEP-CTERM sorting domain-containing protein [Armatimonadetes bacterium]|nr:PEP-CTERM sorting domain-containing protein [Armatimonadota bacterium]